MAKAYFIGGAPRVGKTTLSLNIIEKKPMFGSSTDSIRHMLRTIIPQQDMPSLFVMEMKDTNANSDFILSKEDFGKAIQNQREECRAVWKSVVPLVESHIEDGLDVLIEGLAILPEFMHELSFEHKAVFIGNVSDAHIQTTLEAAVKNPRDWMRNYDRRTAEGFCVFNQHFSRYIKLECEKYGQQYIEIEDTDFKNKLDEALTILIED